MRKEVSGLNRSSFSCVCEVSQRILLDGNRVVQIECQKTCQIAYARGGWLGSDMKKKRKTRHSAHHHFFFQEFPGTVFFFGCVGAPSLLAA